MLDKSIILLSPSYKTENKGVTGKSRKQLQVAPNLAQEQLCILLRNSSQVIKHSCSFIKHYFKNKRTKYKIAINNENVNTRIGVSLFTFFASFAYAYHYLMKLIKIKSLKIQGAQQFQLSLKI